jgi:hypothetical protein
MTGLNGPPGRPEAAAAVTGPPAKSAPVLEEYGVTAPGHFSRPGSEPCSQSAADVCGSCRRRGHSGDAPPS